MAFSEEGGQEEGEKEEGESRICERVNQRGASEGGRREARVQAGGGPERKGLQTEGEGKIGVLMAKESRTVGVRRDSGR